LQGVKTSPNRRQGMLLQMAPPGKRCLNLSSGNGASGNSKGDHSNNLQHWLV